MMCSYLNDGHGNILSSSSGFDLLLSVESSLFDEASTFLVVSLEFSCVTAIVTTGTTGAAILSTGLSILAIDSSSEGFGSKTNISTWNI